MLLIATGLVVALMAWMVLVVHGYDAAPFVRVGGTSIHEPVYRNLTGGFRLFQLSYQIEAIRLLLLVLPCLLGVLLGVPLVAGELGDHTNRLAWTQGISRSRWLATKWLVLAVPAVALSGGLLALSDWWSARVGGVAFGSFVGIIDPILGNAYNSRVVPVTFSVTGIVPVAYTVFALCLGCALGALFRRIPWAVVATVVIYGITLFTMVTSVRPVLAPRTYVPFTSSGYAGGFESVLVRGPAPWNIGEFTRYVPGFVPPTGSPSADTIVSRCGFTPDPPACTAVHHVQIGTIFQLPSHYWVLQWREAAIYLTAVFLLLVVSWWAVRRWRA